MAKKDIYIEKAELDAPSQLLKMKFETYSDNESDSPKRIVIDNQHSFICKNEASNDGNGIASFDLNSDGKEESGSYVFTVDAEFDLSTKPLDVNEDILFVFIFSNDTVGGEYLEAVVPVYFEFSIYKHVYDSIRHDFKDCSNKCSNYDNSANEVILFNGIEYSIAIGDYQRASDYWKLLHGDIATASGCNCG